MTFKLNKLTKVLHPHRQKSLLAAVSAVALMILWSGESFASQPILEEGLDKISDLASGKVAKTGMMVGTVIGTVAGIIKSSISLVLISLGIAVLYSFAIPVIKSIGT